MMEKEEVRKGPWTEQEDVQLVFYVNLFGDRRWDFIAKVSGLKVGGRQNIEVGLFWAWNGFSIRPQNHLTFPPSIFFFPLFVLGLKRTGKSCRLRWVNYLHPGLKRGKMTPNEERLVLELHSKWGNRWSRIARKLPGRTDNEIKNYWRTHMRKKAQDQRKKANKNMSPSSPSSSSSSSSLSSSSSMSGSPTVQGTANKERSFFDTGGKKDSASTVPGEKKTGIEIENQESTKDYSFDEIWNDFELSNAGGCALTCHTMASPLLDYCPANDSLWSMSEEDQSRLFMQPNFGGDFHNSFTAFYNQNMIG